MQTRKQTQSNCCDAVLQQLQDVAGSKGVHPQKQSPAFAPAACSLASGYMHPQLRPLLSGLGPVHDTAQSHASHSCAHLGPIHFAVVGQLGKHDDPGQCVSNLRV